MPRMQNTATMTMTMTTTTTTTTSSAAAAAVSTATTTDSTLSSTTDTSTAATEETTTTTTTTTTTAAAAKPEPEEPVLEGATGDLSESHIYTSADDDDADESGGEATGGGTSANAKSFGGSLPYAARSFSADVLSGYDGCDQLRDDVLSAANFLARRVIERNAAYDDRYYATPGNPMPSVGDTATEEADASDSGAEKSQDGDSSGGGGEDSYDTNVQDADVDEMDAAKSDGNHVWVAYGDTIVMWDAVSGRIVSETVMPPMKYNASLYDDCRHYEPMPDKVKMEEQVGEEVDDEEGGEAISSSPEVLTATAGEGGGTSAAKPVGTESDRGDGKRRKASMAIVPPYGGCFEPPRMTVKGLLLDEDNRRLVAFVQGYQPRFYGWWMPSDDAEDEPILSDYGTTQIKVFDIDAFTDVEVVVDNATYARRQMNLVSSLVLPGRHVDARMIDSTVHAVTMSNVNTYPHLERHLRRWHEDFRGMTGEEYFANATLKAEFVTASFADRLLAEIMVHHGEDNAESTCEDIVRLSVFQTGLDDESLSAHDWWHSRGILGGLVDVTSFDVARDPREHADAADGNDVDDEFDGVARIRSGTSTAFVPTAWGTNVYANKDMLFLANEGWQGWKGREHHKFIPTTYLYAYDLRRSHGNAPVAADRKRNRKGRNLRRAAEGGGGGNPPPPKARAVGVGKAPGRVLNQYSMDMHDGHLRIATTVPGRWGCVALDGEGENYVVERPWTDDAPECVWGQWPPPHNQVTVLSAATEDANGEDGRIGELREVGRTPGSLGEEGETIFAVRFMGDTGFVVTFRRTDPFYVLDLSDHANPAAIGELKIPGFSNYLHPVAEDKLLAVGMDATDDGAATGLQLSLFGFANKTAPELLAKLNVNDEKDDGGDGWSFSHSAAQRDFKAFRWLKESRKVIIPAQIYGGSYNDYFDGFNIFDVNLDGPDTYNITKDFDVNMVERWSEYSCWGGAWVPPRSMVFQGNATFIKGHMARSHRIDTEKFRWETKLDGPIPIPKRECHPYWYRGG
uniref:Uncharacterized protein n=1 Tax=Odontella aurita TaxID=265563 RepID=A0A7S4MIF5_9STRA|mmetsp:Transcript_22867/g.67497  ORF Transcript_22867/g.67497 Transcript_22867/m.67497 type:complete len:1023 (+) Transcript_22867:2-3070(+)